MATMKGDKDLEDSDEDVEKREMDEPSSLPAVLLPAKRTFTESKIDTSIPDTCVDLVSMSQESKSLCNPSKVTLNLQSEPTKSDTPSTEIESGVPNLPKELVKSVTPVKIFLTGAKSLQSLP